MKHRPDISPETVAVLSRLAGFDFEPARCALLAPQLEWLLSGAAQIDALSLSGVEPCSFFHPEGNPSDQPGGSA